MVITETSTLQLSFYSDRLIVSKEPLVAGSACLKKKEIMLRNRSTVYNGFMSPATKRKVRTILTTWINAVKFAKKGNNVKSMDGRRRLTFVTLTLSDDQKHDDNWIKRNMLNKLIIYLKRNHDVRYFFWRAEKQQNGRIHFHLIVDSYIDKRYLQTMWNDIQMSAGYLDTYFAKNKRYNAPSTHIKQVPEGNNVIDYVLKYVTKNPDDIEQVDLQVQGRIWGCSDELKSLKPYSSGEISEIGETLNQMAENEQVEVLDHDHFQIYFIDTERFLKKYHKRVYDQMLIYYQNKYIVLYANSEFEKSIAETVTKLQERGNVKPVQMSLFADMYLDDIQAKAMQRHRNH